MDTAPGLVQWAPGGRLLAVGADYDTDTYRLTADGAAIGERQTNVVRILDVGERTALLLLQTHPTRAKVAELDLVHGTTRRISRSDAWESGSRGGGTVVVASTTWKSTRTAVTVHRADETSFELRSLAETPVLSASLRPGATLLLAGARELADRRAVPAGPRAGQWTAARRHGRRTAGPGTPRSSPAAAASARSSGWPTRASPS